jgi:hypothetical protein
MPEQTEEAKQAKAKQINEALRAAGVADGQGGQQLDKVLEKLTTISTACDTLVKGHADLAKRIDDLEKRGEPGDGKHLPLHRGATAVPGDNVDDRSAEEKRPGTPKQVVADAALSGWVSSDRQRELEMLDTQHAYQQVANVWQEDAPRFMSGQLPIDYRRRLARRWQRFSKQFADAELRTINDPVLKGIEEVIRADTTAAGIAPAEGLGDVLIPRVRTDDTGRRITEWYGQPRAWMRQFSGNRRKVLRFNHNTNFPNN